MGNRELTAFEQTLSISHLETEELTLKLLRAELAGEVIPDYGADYAERDEQTMDNIYAYLQEEKARLAK